MRVTRFKRIENLFFCCVGLTASALVSANSGETFKEGVNYLPIKPPLVVNYGGPGRVKYIKAEISLRTEDAHSATEVSHHMPLIRDTLIMLISSVTDEQMGSGEGKEKMRQEALAKVNEALENIEHPGGAHAEEKAAPKSEKAKDDHAKKDEHGKKEEKVADEKGKGEHGGKVVTDLLFDNLVVQK